MGQLLLGRLAETKRWKKVVALLRAGSSVAELAEALAPVECILAVEAPPEPSDLPRKKAIQ